MSDHNASEIIDRLGGTAAVARMCNVRPASVSEWRKRGVPVTRCLAIESASEGQVTRHQLRPDVFGETPPAPVQEAG